MSKILDLLDKVQPLKIALAGMLLAAVAAGIQEVRIQHLKTDVARAEASTAQVTADKSLVERDRDALALALERQNDAINGLWLAGQHKQTEATLRSSQTLLQFERARQKIKDQKITGPEDMNSWLRNAFH